MKAPMVGSLIYGDHKVPRRSRPWRQRLKLPVAVGFVFLVITALVYKFCNYREEGSVSRFLADVSAGQVDAAFQDWDLEGGSYTRKDFLDDWGPTGYYSKDVRSAKVIDSNSKGPVVIVYIGSDTMRVPLALRIDKESLKLSYSPTNKYKARAK